MPTIIDSLIVTMGLDPAEFKKGAETVNKEQKKIVDTSARTTKEVDRQEKSLSKAQAERAKELEARSKAIAHGFSKIRNEALALLSLFTAGMGIKNFAVNAINAGASIGKLAVNLGMSTERLSAYGQASERAGGSVEGMNAQLKESANAIAKLRNGQGPDEGMQWFFRLGGSPDALKDGNTYLLARADLLAKIAKTDPSGAMLAAQNMGISEDQLNFMKQGSELIRQQVAEREKLARFSKKDAEDANTARIQMLDLKQTIERLSTKVLLDLVPALNTVAKILIESLDAYEHFFKTKMGVTVVKKSTNGKDLTDEILESFSKKNLEKLSGGLSISKSKSPTAGTAPRGIRNNNPGNIEYGAFAKKHGATGSDGRFAIFPSMEQGQAAQQALLSGYLSSGTNTIRKAINKWAPSSENNTSAYVNSVSRQMGIGADQQLNASHIPALADAIARHENGAAYANAIGAANMPARAASASRGAIGGNTSTTEVKVGEINVHTQATDADGIAKSIGGAVKQYGFVPQANTGMS